MTWPIVCLCCICSGVVLVNKLYYFHWPTARVSPTLICTSGVELFSHYLCMLVYYFMYVCYYVCLYAFIHVYVSLCVCIYIHTYIYIYIICFVHMGYFVMLWGGGGTVVFVFFMFCCSMIFCNKIFLYNKNWKSSAQSSSICFEQF